jgi:serine/threonine protein kinase
LGRYEILDRLGAGGMGEVYRARDLEVGREVAIKVPRGETFRDLQPGRRFEREARVAAALDHPNTVAIHDVAEEDGIRYIAMELVAGKTLRDRLGKASMATDEILWISVQIVAGLAEMHAVGVVHRDLKPDNIMVTDSGQVKILDFGLAKYSARRGQDGPRGLATAPEVTRAGVILGTASYMSPEQAAGRPVDFRSDQFSLGSILYEMATGRRAFKRKTAPQTLAAIIEAEPVPVLRLNGRLPQGLVRVITRCLSKRPDRRYRSTRTLANALAEIRPDQATAVSA